MKDKSLMGALAAVWVPTALAVAAGLYFTRDMRCLWFMLVPSLVSIKTTSRESKDDEDKHNTEDN